MTPAGVVVGAGRRADRVVPARFSRHRARLARWRRSSPTRGWRVVAPFMRGYAPSSIPSDGSYHVGALMDDALRVLDAVGPTGRDVIIGHDWGAIAGSGLAAMPDSPFPRPSSCRSRPQALPAARSGARRRQLAAQLPRQLLRSWYIMYFQLPFLPERSASWVVPRLWRHGRPAMTPTRIWALVLAAIGAPRTGVPRSATTGRPSAAASRPRDTPICTDHWLSPLGCRRCTCTATTTVAAIVRLHAAGGCPRLPPSRRRAEMVEQREAHGSLSQLEQPDARRAPHRRLHRAGTSASSGRVAAGQQRHQQPARRQPVEHAAPTLLTRPGR